MAIPVSLFKQNDIITLMNPDNEDFEFEYNRAEGNLPYIIPAGEVRRFPGWLAAHGLKHLIDLLITKSGKKTNNVVLRQEWATKIVISTESLQRKREPSEADLLREKIKDLNQPSDLELLLNQRSAKDEVEQREKEPEVKETPKPKEPDPVLVKEPKNIPTRNELLDYARNTLKMNMDEKTVKNLKKMKVADLIKELNYPTE